MVYSTNVSLILPGMHFLNTIILLHTEIVFYYLKILILAKLQSALHGKKLNDGEKQQKRSE